MSASRLQGWMEPRQVLRKCKSMGEHEQKTQQENSKSHRHVVCLNMCGRMRATLGDLSFSLSLMTASGAWLVIAATFDCRWLLFRRKQTFA